MRFLKVDPEVNYLKYNIDFDPDNERDNDLNHDVSIEDIKQDLRLEMGWEYVDVPAVFNDAGNYIEMPAPTGSNFFAECMMDMAFRVYSEEDYKDLNYLYQKHSFDGNTDDMKYKYVTLSKKYPNWRWEMNASSGLFLQHERYKNNYILSGELIMHDALPSSMLGFKIYYNEYLPDIFPANIVPFVPLKLVNRTNKKLIALRIHPIPHKLGADGRYHLDTSILDKMTGGIFSRYYDKSLKC